MGILSKTLIRSPVTRWLLPGALRSKNQHDVAFVSEMHVELKNLHRDGSLESIGSRGGFGSRIRAVGILGEAARPHSFAKHPPYTLEPALDSIVPENVPPQFLVLAHEYPPELRFLIVDHDSDRTLRFHERIEALPTQGDFRTQPGHLLSVDPESRALAVAAAKKNVVVYRLANLADLGAQYLGDKRSWSPIVERKVLKTPGYIRHMEFLRMGADQAGWIALILVIVAENRSRLCWYLWRDNQSIGTPRGPFMHPLEKGTSTSHRP
jgi:hypothetical protein